MDWVWYHTIPYHTIYVWSKGVGQTILPITSCKCPMMYSFMIWHLIDFNVADFCFWHMWCHPHHCFKLWRLSAQTPVLWQYFLFHLDITRYCHLLQTSQSLVSWWVQCQDEWIHTHLTREEFCPTLKELHPKRLSNLPMLWAGIHILTPHPPPRGHAIPHRFPRLNLNEWHPLPSSLLPPLPPGSSFTLLLLLWMLLWILSSLELNVLFSDWSTFNGRRSKIAIPVDLALWEIPLVDWCLVWYWCVEWWGEECESKEGVLILKGSESAMHILWLTRRFIFGDSGLERREGYVSINGYIYAWICGGITCCTSTLSTVGSVWLSCYHSKFAVHLGGNGGVILDEEGVWQVGDMWFVMEYCLLFVW